MAGRPSLPLALHALTGADRKNPQRFVDRPPEPETKGPIGDPPAAFLIADSDGLKRLELWKKIVAESPIGVLTASDAEFVETMVNNGIEAKRKGSRMQPRFAKEYAANLKSIGMTPEGRAIRGLGGKTSSAKSVNPLDEFTKARDRNRRRAG